MLQNFATTPSLGILNEHVHVIYQLIKLKFYLIEPLCSLYIGKENLEEQETDLHFFLVPEKLTECQSKGIIFCYELFLAEEFHDFCLGQGYLM